MQKQQRRRLSMTARLYIAAVGLAGMVGAIYTFRSSRVEISARFILYLCIALAGSGMKVTLPGVCGNISVNYVFTFLSLLEFKAPETLLLALSSVVVQTFWRAQDRPRAVHVFFNLSCIAITVIAAIFIYRQPWFTSVSEGQLLRLTIAGVVYFIVNTLSVSLVIALAEGSRLKTVWKAVFDWSFSYYLVGVCLAVMVHLSIERIGWTFTVALIPVLYMVYRFYKLSTSKMQQEKTHAESTAALHLRTIEALAMAIEAKDQCTHDHLCRVQAYCLEIARILGLSAEEVQALHAASILHDIGKLAVPDYIISKPGKLTPEEFEKVKIHSTVGAAILDQVGFPYAVAPIVRSHHEKWDGTGYPDGLKEEQIPIGARILAAVDCLDAIATDRQYRRAMPLNEAMEYISSMSGCSFDPKVVDVMKRHYLEFEALAKHSPMRRALVEEDLIVARGKAPEAGFQSDGTGLSKTEEQAQAFIASIASARHEVQTILELTQELSGSLRLEEMLLLVSERLRQLVPFDCIAVYVRQGAVLKAKYARGPRSHLLAAVEIPVGQGLSGWVAENAKSILNGNPAMEPGYLQDGGELTWLKSALSVPLNGGSEQFAGALTLYREEPNAYNKDHLRILLAVNDKISRAVERAMAFQQARHEADTDELTGLPNARSLFVHMERELTRCESQNGGLAVMVCDLDGFKDVNDSFGHLVGNEVLKRVAGILRANCRDSDYVGRVGGDEFVLVLIGIGAEELATKTEVLDRMIRLASLEICGDEKLGISVGVAHFPEHGSDAESLLSHADKEMYHAKRVRRQCPQKSVEGLGMGLAGLSEFINAAGSIRQSVGDLETSGDGL
jgi:diguanylate cyclase (GGDEF)-like protein/putative nucleotidyltransferase with HDIG domain